MVEPIKNNILTGTATAATSTADKTSSGAITGGVLGAVATGGLALLAMGGAKIGGFGNFLKWTLAGGAAAAGGVAGAAVGTAAGSVKGLADGIDKIQAQNAAHANLEMELANQQMNKIADMQGQQLASNAQAAYQQGMLDASQAMEQQFLAAAAQAHGAAAGSQEAPAQGGRFTSMAPAPGSIKPDAIQEAKAEMGPRQI
jgi:hypothetical protein